MGQEDVRCHEQLLAKLLDEAVKLGASYADVRYDIHESELVTAENKRLKAYSSDSLSGTGIRVVVGDSLGFASTSDLAKDNLEKALRCAIKTARVAKGIKPFLSPVKINVAHDRLNIKVEPQDVPPEEKVSIVLDANKAAYTSDDVKSTLTLLGLTKDARLLMSTEGAQVSVESTLVGFAHMSIAQANGIMENVTYFDSACSGFEFIKSKDWLPFCQDLSKIAIEAAKAGTPKSGTYPVVVDPEVLGVVLHEAFGHAAEGDFVANRSSVLHKMVGTQIASEQVTVIDEGVVEGGFYCPYDDEGVKKERTVVVEEGILRNYLLDRHSAEEIGGTSTGNGRAQDFQNLPIVRQTNLYVEAGDYSLEEMIEDVDYGIFVEAKGLQGGEVNPGMGSFTFGVGPSRIIEKGELKDIVKGVVISGSILDTLKTVDAVGKDVKITTNAFGGCGKFGQRAWVGDGGPQMRIKKMTVGGR
jgi:TldD protein